MVEAPHTKAGVKDGSAKIARNTTSPIMKLPHPPLRLLTSSFQIFSLRLSFGFIGSNVLISVIRFLL
jgi:hypothetical protein